MLGVVVDEEVEDEDVNIINIFFVNNDYLEVMGKFENFGLLEFLRGFWLNGG